MIFKIIKPSSELAAYIKSYWIMESGNDNSTVSDRVIPTGSCELMFHFGNPFKTVDGNNISKIQPNFFLCGQKNTYYDASTMGNTGLLAVTFKPHGAKLFFNMPINLIQNLNVSLDDFLGKEGLEIGCRIADANDNLTRIRILEKFLQRRIIFNKMHDFRRIDSALNKIYMRKGMLNIEELSDVACLSNRQFERKFSEFTGLSPKQFLRIARFQHIINLKNKNKHLSLTQLAYEAGYYDQSHFINEFKLLSGYTPKEFFNLDCTTSDMYGIE